MLLGQSNIHINSKYWLLPYAIIKSVPRDFILKNESYNTKTSRTQYMRISSWSKISYWDTESTNHTGKKLDYIKIKKFSL